MLMKINPDKVVENWEFIAPLIAKSLPPHVGSSYRGMVNVLEAVLMETLICWGFYDEEDNLLFLVTTVYDHDEVSKTRNLLIYTFSSLVTINRKMFFEALESLKKFAGAHECEFITAYVENESIIEQLEIAGFRSNFKFVSLEV